MYLFPDSTRRAGDEWLSSTVELPVAVASQFSVQIGHLNPWLEDRSAQQRLDIFGRPAW